MNSFISIFSTLLRRVFALGGGFLAAILLVELGLQILPVKTGLIRPEGSSTVIEGAKRELSINAWEPYTQYTSSTGWSLDNVRRGATNNYGYIAPFDYRSGQKALVVIGDSYIEAQMNDYQQTLQGRLGQHSLFPVYSIGYSGFSLADYLAAAQFVSSEFNPLGLVITVSTGDIIGSTGTLAEGAYYVDGIMNEAPLRLKRPHSTGQESWLRNITKHSATLRYLWLNLQFQTNFSKIKEWLTGGRRVDQARLDEKQKRDLVNFLLGEFSKLPIPSERILFVLDGDRSAIYEGKESTRDEVYSYFYDRALEQGFQVVDLDIVFRRHYNEQGLRFDYYPKDGHWNFLGHQIVAEVVEGYIDSSWETSTQMAMK